MSDLHIVLADVLGQEKFAAILAGDADETAAAVARLRDWAEDIAAMGRERADAVGAAA